MARTATKPYLIYFYHNFRKHQNVYNISHLALIFHNFIICSDPQLDFYGLCSPESSVAKEEGLGGEGIGAEANTGNGYPSAKSLNYCPFSHSIVINGHNIECIYAFRLHYLSSSAHTFLQRSDWDQWETVITVTQVCGHHCPEF